VLAVQTEHNKDYTKKGFMTVSMEKVCMAKSWPQDYLKITLRYNNQINHIINPDLGREVIIFIII